MPSLRVKLLTGRSLEQGKTKWRSKFSDEYFRSVAICELDPEDMRALDISEGENIRVKTEHNSVILRAVTSKQIPHRGIAFIPYGPWANYVITDAGTQGSGMPSFKAIDAELTSSPKEKVLSLRELIREIMEVG